MGITYRPKRGDVVWLDFEPSSGREIRKRRPALVLSPLYYNQVTGSCLVCPISSKQKEHLFEVPITIKGKHSVVKSDQVKSIDWECRNADFLAKASKTVLRSVSDNVRSLMEDNV